MLPRDDAQRTELSAIRASTSKPRSACGAARQAHREHRTLARLARHGHVTALQARELTGDGETEPRPAEALSGRGIGLAELLEQPCLLLRSHANAGVSDRELNPLATVCDPTCP